ncbi:MAG TPA: DUF3465 domain-containing protein [Candidatus Cybelea sp.]|jgi:hypothetical protein|nr:DUF3465 domain-containing protein [Candidatus Cybelea sp.]
MIDARAALVVAALASLCACAASQPTDDRAVCGAFSAARSGVEVVAGGSITRIFGVRPGRTSPHEGFLMHLDSGCDLVVRVEVNTDFTGDIPLRAGENVAVKGEYEYYPRGGVIHWTHRDPRGRHENGYVQAGGQMYY